MSEGFSRMTDEEYELRVLIVGDAGSGKSTLGNKLIGKTDVYASTSEGNLTEEVQPRAGFMVPKGFDSATRKSQYQTGSLPWEDKTISMKVVDTPVLFDPRADLSKTRQEIKRGLALCCPEGPHAILFVLPHSC